MLGQVALVAELNDIEIVGILDHHYLGNTDNICGIPIIGDERWLLDPTNRQAKSWLATCDFFPANWPNGSQNVNSNGPDIQQLRIQRIDILEKSGASVINLIHPETKLYGLTSKYGNYKIGKGIFIDSGGWHSVDDVVIGDYCVFHVGCRVSHNTKIGKNVLFAPGTHYQDCEIGDHCFLGMNSRISVKRSRHMTKIGSFSTVWTESSIEKDIPFNSIYTNHNKILKKMLPPPMVEF